ncbi:hypothetical protein SLEP1_g11957 [Rubroshorea leprosula]|nr:hypothetical protein SLEP1_g11957 [Rubroshorea leprosula]
MTKLSFAVQIWELGLLSDICFFELIKGIEPSFNVIIISADADEYIPLSSQANATEPNQVPFYKLLVPKIEFDQCCDFNTGNSDSDKQSMKQGFQPTEHKTEPSGLELSECGKTQKSAGLQAHPQSSSLLPSLPLEATENQTTKYSLKVVLKPYHIKHASVVLPSHVVEKFIKQKPKSWMVQVEDRVWHLKVTRTKSQTTLSAGFSAFVKDNSLKAGDTCIFEIVEESSATMKLGLEAGANDGPFIRVISSSPILYPYQISGWWTSPNTHRALACCINCEKESEGAVSAMKSTGLGGQGCKEFTSDTPHFFKIILDDADRCEKLRIPKQFVKRFGSDISSPVFLKVPSGAVWRVELQTCADDTWLHNGWPEFATHYSLGYGSLTVFRYEGNCHFHVIIFDRSASEIAYPYRRTHGRVHNNGDSQDPKMEDDVSVEILDDIPPSKKTRVRSPSPSSQPNKMLRSTSNIRPPEINSRKVKYDIPEPEFNAKQIVKHPQVEVWRRKPTLGQKKKAEALLRASSFKSKNPFFVVVMQPSYIIGKCRLFIPTDFWRNYFPKHNGESIRCICDGKTWSVVYSGGVSPKLGGGWKKFVKENDLKVGDVCVFELISKTKITFNVAIFHRAQDGKIGQSPAKGRSGTAQKCHIPNVAPRKQALKPTETARAPQIFTSFKSENPFFAVTIHPSYVLSNVTVSYSFMKEHIEQNAKNVKLQVGDRLWLVKLLRHSQYKKAALSSGWQIFVRENSVVVGEVCVFELINREDAVLRVHIFRKSAV